jgi:hypothetical protein
MRKERGSTLAVIGFNRSIHLAKDKVIDYNNRGECRVDNFSRNIIVDLTLIVLL